MKKLERKLRRTARRKGLNGRAASKYVWGALTRMGAGPKRTENHRE
jgi:hypothetical protein